MKMIGLIGGVTWESTIDYYRTINTEVSRRLGGAHSAELALVSLDFDRVMARTRAGDEEAVFAMYFDAATKLKRCGASFLILCANTAHRRADRLSREVQLPLLHIGDATGSAIRRAGLAVVGLIGTRRTMEEAFIIGRLQESHGVSVLVPDEPHRQEIDRLIYVEMATGVFSDYARSVVADAARTLTARGAQGLILGCTELPILMRGHELGGITFNTTELHAIAAVEHALEEE
jgi:aspartate racemase